MASHIAMVHRSIGEVLKELSSLSVDGSVLKSTGIAKCIGKLASNKLLTEDLRHQCAQIKSGWMDQVKKDNKDSSIKALKGGCIVPLPEGDDYQRLPPLSSLPSLLWQAFTRDYNKSQLLAIDHITRPLSKSLDTRISLVQGPPGTGKTSTVRLISLLGCLDAFIKLSFL